MIADMIPPIANRFVAGETPPEALDHVIDLNAGGIGGIINLLGEHYDARPDVASDTQEYLELLEDIDRNDLQACISVKPTQLGLDISESLFREQLTRIVDTARERDEFVWIDMEDADTTEATIDAFTAMTDRYPHGVGLCLQANLYRTGEDVRSLAGLPGKIRLVKGAYREPSEIAYREAEAVNAAFREHLETLFRHHDGGIAIASHDPAMIEHAKQLHHVHGTEMEFQLLMGVRSDARDELAETYPVYEYIPYGPRWRSYFFRRVIERTENVKFALRAIVGSRSG